MSITLTIVMIVAAIIAGIIFVMLIKPSMKIRKNLSRLGPEAPSLVVDGKIYRDLNKNGKLDPYEDARCPIDERVQDLLAQMTLEEKAGLMFHAMIGMNPDGSLVEKASMQSGPTVTSEVVAVKLMNHFNLLYGQKPRVMAEWQNRLQKMAERTRLGIPVTISSDPRHAFSNNLGANMPPGDFSQW